MLIKRIEMKSQLSIIANTETMLCTTHVLVFKRIYFKREVQAF